MTRSALRLALLVLAPTPVVAQAAPATDPLVIFGIKAGAPVREVAEIIADRDGGHLRCDRSKVDLRVEECRATVSVPEAAEPLELWMSAIDRSLPSCTMLMLTVARGPFGPPARFLRMPFSTQVTGAAGVLSPIIGV